MEAAVDPATGALTETRVVDGVAKPSYLTFKHTDAGPNPLRRLRDSTECGRCLRHRRSGAPPDL
ncbi:hypothetical protein [Streptomyces sp. NPDC056891]|uniref:hypothetical protein n=1 Tax=unclassified Streptomyces TaxID=2593676 RepID=UPI0036B16DEE